MLHKEGDRWMCVWEKLRLMSLDVGTSEKNKMCVGLSELYI